MSQQQLIEYAYATGLVLSTEGDRVIHAPFFARPSKFPRSAFEQATSLAPIFHKLMYGVANDLHFLQECLSGADEFTRRLLGIAERTARPSVQCAVLRSDYMVAGDGRLLQVELNTIAASFGALSPRVTRLHRAMYPQWASRLPENASDIRIPQGLLAAWKCYAKTSSVIVFLVQPNEGNRYDQLHFQYWLGEQGVTVLRRTFDELVDQASVSQDGQLMLQGGTEVALVYLRAGYTPKDYSREEHWELLERLEQSNVIMVPSVSWHLSGAKKVQQMLASPAVVRRYLKTEQDALQVEACFAGIYALDAESTEKALAAPDDYVLKPQREGGGNNLYGEDMIKLIKQMPASEHGGYILMELIKPIPQTNTLIRKHEGKDVSTVSELGIYSVFVHDGSQVLVDEAAGHLLRTKEASVKEAGVSAGFGAFDSPLLID